MYKDFETGIDLDPDELYQAFKRIGCIDEQWKKTPASKTHKMEITIHWDKIFDPEDK